MKFKQFIFIGFIVILLLPELGCASRAAIKDYNKAEWVYLGRGAELEKLLIENKISYEVNPVGGISVERSSLKRINDQVRTGVILCFAIPFDVATYPFQLIGLNPGSSSSGKESGDNFNWGSVIGSLLLLGFSH